MLPEAHSAVRLYDPRSADLLAVGHKVGEQPFLDRFACDWGNGTLLAYYFGKGKRDVLVRAATNEGATAHLRTRWRGGQREWTLDW